MNEKYESSKENDETDSLTINIDNAQDDNHKSKKSSCSSFSSFEKGKTDPEKIKAQKQDEDLFFAMIIIVFL